MTSTPTAQVGNYLMWKTSPSTYVLRHTDGTAAGTFPTARAASTAAIALITAAHKAAK
jgi:hypothetical protein